MNIKPKVALFVFSRAHDKSCAGLMEILRERFKNEIEFVGVGGKHMLAAGLQESMFEIEKVWDKPALIWRGVPQYSREQGVLSGQNKHKMQANTLRHIRQTRVYEKTLAHNPSAILSFGEHKFCYNVCMNLEQLQRQSLVNKPQKLHVGRFGCPPDQPEGREWELHRDDVIDHTYFSIPFEESSIWDDIKQSKLHVGDYTTYKAFDFLVSRSEYQHTLRRSADSILLNRQFTKQILLDLKKEEGARFRKKSNIGQRDFVMFFGIGNRIWENVHMMEALEALEKFVYFVKARRREFVLVMPFEGEVQGQGVRELAERLKVRVVCPQDEETKLSSMAASDMGICQNGAMVNELGMNLVPTIVSQNLDHQEHQGLLRKSKLVSDVNIALNGPVMPELFTGEWNTELIQDHLAEMQEVYSENNQGTIRNDTWATSTTRSVIRLMAWKEFDEQDLDSVPYGQDLYQNPNRLILDHLENVIRNQDVKKKGVLPGRIVPNLYGYKSNEEHALKL